MKTMKKKLAVAVTVALLAFPLSTALAHTAIPTLTTTVSATTTQDTTVSATTTLQAEVAVAAYEAAPITTLAEVTTAECLKAAADTAVAVVVDVDAKAVFEARVTTQAALIATAKTALQVAAAEAVVVAEAAVVAYEAGPITTLAEVATAEGLKAAADTAVAVVNGDAKTAFELRVTNRAAAIATAKTALTVPVVDPDGKIVIPSTQFSDFIDKLQLALAFDPAHQCELNKRHALRKLAQAQQLMKDGNIEACKISFNEYKDKIAKAQAFLLEAEDTNSATAKTLAIALANVDAKNIQVLSNLVVKLPPQAAQKLALNVVRTMDKAVIKIQKEEAKVDPVLPADTEKKQLEKQAETALTEFKKSVNVKDKITDQKAKVNHYTTEQKRSEVNQKFENLSHLNFRTSDNNKDDLNKQGDRDKDKGGDNNRQDH